MEAADRAVGCLPGLHQKLAEIGILTEKKVDKEKLYVNPILGMLLTSEQADVEPRSKKPFLKGGPFDRILTW